MKFVCLYSVMPLVSPHTHKMLKQGTRITLLLDMHRGPCKRKQEHGISTARSSTVMPDGVTVKSRVQPLVYSPSNIDPKSAANDKSTRICIPMGLYAELMDFFQCFYMFFLKITLKSRNMYSPWGLYETYIFYCCFYLVFLKVTINSIKHKVCSKRIWKHSYIHPISLLYLRNESALAAVLWIICAK